ncbi:beta-ketoacyl-[acyl-carrier-protein] synthase family protein [Paenibacillus sp. M1]|uniref:Beta-ketoacyl-[acyl-carrier-protein] synthase family protein n=1 Tax=Paenibacillus haidiansis TaxID=1574488 RepID=A0ABU7VRU1_9BACL
MEQVVVTGMGVISTAGHNLSDFWTTLESGTITYGVIREFAEDLNYRIKIGSRIEDQSWQRHLDESISRQYGRAAQYAMSASLDALEHAGLNREEIREARTAICIGTTMGEIQAEEQLSEWRHRTGGELLPDHLLRQYSTNRISYAVKRAIGAHGPIFTIPAACAAGNYSLAIAKRFIEWGQADIAIAGGVDIFSRVAFVGFQRLLSLADNLCRPFDHKRKGLVVGEGCGIVILERLSHAKARGAKIWGEIAGVGLTSDRYHMTAPHPEGDGAVRAMELAIQEAGLSVHEIDYISAHGTGTVANDKTEVKAMSRVFGEESIPPFSSIKSMLGHSLGAAASLELIACLQMLDKGVMLPTVNFSAAQFDCSIDCVPNTPRKSNIQQIISNSFAFGGQVSSIVVRGEEGL